MLTLLVPVAILAALELTLRLVWSGGTIPVFERVAAPGAELLTPASGVARRYFAAEGDPPAPPTDVFAAAKPPHAFRLFVLGESSAAGFPYPHNGTFSRLLRDALRDVLPGDSVEVVNMGIAATNSYTISDLASAVIDQHPDAVLIYSGHNEYYGAMGVGSAVRVGPSRAVTRAYLAAERLRIFMALRAGIGAVQRRARDSAPHDSTVATIMETIAADQAILSGGPAYREGLRHFSDNIGTSLRDFRAHGIPVYLASIESNVRDQLPFVSSANGPAAAAYNAGRAALARGDTASARMLLLRARELDVIRFRAPAAMNDAIRTLATREGVRYVPVAERLDSLSPGGLPGAELFLEHVHPNARGYAEIGRAFFEALRRDGFLGHRADLGRLASWEEYQRRMELSPFDMRIVEHTVKTVTTRWPFVDRQRSLDYRGTYRPHGLVDSLALLVSRGGMSWGEGKLRLGAEYERSGHPDSALAEYRGLVRDAEWRELPNRLAGRALLALDRVPEASVMLDRAARIEATPDGTYLRGVAALRRREYDAAIASLDQAVRMAPGATAPLYQLSLAFGLSRNEAAARGAAARLAQLDPHYPGLAAWMRALGMSPP